MSDNDRLRTALLDILSVLGPNAPDHEDVCEGCQHEIGEAIEIARAALGEASRVPPSDGRSLEG